MPGHPNIFDVGDTIHLEMAKGQLTPGIAPAAKQEGRYVADAIKSRLRGEAAQAPFHYGQEGGPDAQIRRDADHKL